MFRETTSFNILLALGFLNAQVNGFFSPPSRTGELNSQLLAPVHLGQTATELQHQVSSKTRRHDKVRQHK